MHWSISLLLVRFLEIAISMKPIFVLLFFLTVFLGFGQIEEEKIDSTAYYVRMEGDSSWIKAIALDDVYIFGKLEFADRKEKLRYYILRRKTLKVYPYAKLAAERLVVERYSGRTFYRENSCQRPWTPWLDRIEHMSHTTRAGASHGNIVPMECWKSVVGGTMLSEPLVVEIQW